MKDLLASSKPFIDAVEEALGDPAKHFYSHCEFDGLCLSCGKPLEEHPMGTTDGETVEW